MLMGGNPGKRMHGSHSDIPEGKETQTSANMIVSTRG